MSGWNAGVTAGGPGPKVRVRKSPLEVNPPNRSITTSVGADAYTHIPASVRPIDMATRFATSRPGPKLTLDVVGDDPHGYTVRKPAAFARVARTFTTAERVPGRTRL